MVNRDEVLDFVKRKGPCIPNHIKKELGSDTMVLGAILSELSSKGLVKISSTKIGGSPNYYIPGSEYKLESLRKWLNEKDQRAFDLLKEKKILRDYDQTPLVRVSLRSIKDFAKPLEVKMGEQTEIFWKWHILSMSEAENMIKNVLIPAKSEAPEPEPEAKPDPVATPAPAANEAPPSAPEPKKEEKRHEEEKKEIKEERKVVTAAPSAEKEKVAEPEKKVLKEVDDTGDAFMKKLKSYFEEKRIRIIEKIKVKKNSQAELIVDLPTSVGRMEYYCQAKKKKKCNDGDLSSAYIIGQAKKMPVLFLTAGELTKKAEAMLHKEFKGMVVKKI